MAVKIRLRRMGSHKRPFYRVVAADSRYQRDGRFLEILGFYNPMDTPFTLKVDREKVLNWLRKGAQMTQTAESLLRREGIVQAFNMEKISSKVASATEEKAQEEISDDREVKTDTEE